MPGADRAMGNWGPGLQWRPEPSACPAHPGAQATGAAHALLSHTHMVEKHGPDQRRHSYMLSHPLNKCSQNTYHVPGSVWACARVSNPHFTREGWEHVKGMFGLSQLLGEMLSVLNKQARNAKRLAVPSRVPRNAESPTP